MKTLTALLIMFSLCGAALFAQEAVESTGETKVEKKGIISTIISDMTESARIINEINKENMAAVKEESKANFDNATAPNPGLTKLNETKGFWNKIKVIFENIAEDASINTEKERARRAEIQSHESYRATLEDQRTNRQSTTTH